MADPGVMVVGINRMEDKIMRRIILPIAAVICGLGLILSCGKEVQEQVLEPVQELVTEDNSTAESIIYLTAEGFGGADTRVSVLDDTVIWETGDVVGFNYMGQSPVTVDGDKAYIAGGSFGTVCALYPCPSEANFFISTTPTITVPATYSSANNYMVGARQHIPLPMGSYYNSSGNPKSLTFRHVTAAVKVMLWNACSQDIIVDQVVVKTDTYRINGSVTLDLRDGNLGVAASYESSSASDRSVTVQFPSSGEGALTIAAGDNTKSVQVPILPIEADNITIEVYAHTASFSTSLKVYSYTASSPALARNQMLTAKVKVNTDFPSRIVTLSGSSYTAQDGDMLTGTAGQNAQIKIANNAKVFLNNVTINVPENDGHRYSALTCEGNATIVLFGNNNITGGKLATGLQAGEPGTTLTIKGTGSLTTTGRKNGAGIGSVNTAESGRVKDCGNIVIKSGTITAYGGSYAAGIGGASDMDCGNITIEGGNVTAYGGNWAAGIGSSDSGSFTEATQCGSITISGGTVYAKGGVLAAGIGCGVYGCCGAITITSGVTRVEAVKGDDDGGNSAPCSIGKSLGGMGFPDSKSGIIKIGDTYYYSITDSPFVYQP